MQKVQVFSKGESGFQLFRTIEVGSPLSKVSVERDGDILIVPSVVDIKSYVFQYHACTENYNSLTDLISGSYDESTAMNAQFILQGKSDGSIKVTEYAWVENSTSTC